jgi:colanic acid biosynthesis glycosyl transferase WcaI
MQKVIFLNRYFFPDHSATSQILSDLAFHLAACGRCIHVITSRQRYDDPSALLAEREIISGVHVRRVNTTRFGRRQLVGRAIDYFSFYAAARAALLEVAAPQDIIVVKTDPPLLSVVALQVASHHGVQLVNWLQDLYPEIAIELQVPWLRGPVASGLTAWRDRSLRRAAMNVVVGRKMAARLASRGVDSHKVVVIPNWCNDTEIVPTPGDDNPLRRKWGLEGKFVVGYSGNLGRVHEFETILNAAGQLRGKDRIAFLFIGGGHSFDALAQQVKERSLEGTCRFLPYQERAVLKLSLGVADVHLLSLRPEVEALVVPSKFYGIAAAGRPILAITAADGEFAPIIEAHQCGLVIEPGRGGELAQAIAMLSEDPTRCISMGQRARAMLESEFTRESAFEQWRNLLDQVGSSGRAH